MKRKHYPVQCGRCFRVFSAADRSKALSDLGEHNRSTTLCELKSASLKEGISDSQWAQLEKKKSTKKDQETSTVEKWYEIWAILFPDVGEESRPKTPCKLIEFGFARELTFLGYDNSTMENTGRLLSEESMRFDRMFRLILRNKVSEGEIRFEQGTTEEMIGRLEILAHNAFKINAGLYEPSSTTTSSSASRRALMSLLGGSYEHIPSHIPSGAHPSPLADPTTTMSSLVGGSSSRIPSSIARQGSGSNTITSGIPNERSVHANYPLRLASPMDAFENQSLDPNIDPFYGFQYTAPFAAENEMPNLGRPSMTNASSTNLDPPFIDPSDNGVHFNNMGSWDQFSSGQGYGGGS